MPEKLKLGENHRRVVSVLLRGIEQMCSQIETSLEETGGLLQRSVVDFSPEQSRQLKQKTHEVRQELARIASEIEVDRAALSARRRILALISSSIVNLEESDAAKLRGYGPLPDSAARKLQSEFSRLHALLEEMAADLE